MKKISLFAAFLLTIASCAMAQNKYFTREGKISFFSKTDMEDIDAHNSKVASVFDAATGSIEFSCLMKAFEFKKALMQEHFNENYVESTKYPKAQFKGKIVNLSSVNFKKDGEYPVEVAGNMTIKDVTKPVTTKGKIIIMNGLPQGLAEFRIKPEDYHIQIPAIVRNNISEQVDVKVNMNYQILNK